MDNDSLLLLQKIDCNCNDCSFMIRDVNEFNLSLERHHKWQLDYFYVLRNKLIEKAKWWRNRFNDLDKWDRLLTEADNMKFQFNKAECRLNYGSCSKLNKPVSFIPNTCQLDTQDCFKHRKEAI